MLRVQTERNFHSLRQFLRAKNCLKGAQQPKIYLLTSDVRAAYCEDKPRVGCWMTSRRSRQSGPGHEEGEYDVDSISPITITGNITGNSITGKLPFQLPACHSRRPSTEFAFAISCKQAVSE